MKKLSTAGERKEQENRHCSHYFEYSHKEYAGSDLSTAGMINSSSQDVIICIKCGLTRRQ